MTAITELEGLVARADTPTRAAIREYKAAMERDVCAHCRLPADFLDHIESRSRGGANRWWNLSGICRTCNTRKRDLSLLGFLGAETFRPVYNLATMIWRDWRGVGV